MNAPPTRPADEPAYLDEQALARLRSLDPDGSSGVVRRVMQTFENSLQRLLGQLAEARDRGDTAGVGGVAHTLKSSSASVGALALSGLCAEAERAVRHQQTDGLPALVTDLLAEGERALAAVRAILRE